MVDHWDRAHLARMRAGRPRSQDADASIFLHFAIGVFQDPVEFSSI